MPTGSIPLTETPSAADRLTAAVIGLWETEGAAAVSARVLARAADVPVSSIYHHFGDMDGLVAAAGERALAAATAWSARQCDLLVGMAGDPAGFAPLLAALIDDWCEAQRPLAFAWREVQMRAMRDAAHRRPAMAWQANWHDLFATLAPRFGLDGLVPELVALFDGESGLHLLRWRRPVDRIALDEICAAWGGWCMGVTGLPAPWRTMAQRAAIAGQPPDPPWDAAAERIAAAAAATIARSGLPGLTHRAVAATADMTLGVVSNRFRSSADLLRAAFENVYRRIVAPLDAGGAAHIMPVVPAPASGRPSPIDEIALRASFELMLAAARDPLFRPFTAQLRYLRGRTSGRYLRMAVGPDRFLSPADLALMSGILSGHSRAGLCGIQTDDAMPARLIDRLGATRAVDPSA